MPRDARTLRKLKPEAEWGWDQILANKTNYLLEMLVWMKTKDAQKKMPANKPKLFVPDFMDQDSDKDMEIHTTEEIDHILQMRRIE